MEKLDEQSFCEPHLKIYKRPVYTYFDVFSREVISVGFANCRIGSGRAKQM
jgi:hypothetical protein